MPAKNNSSLSRHMSTFSLKRDNALISGYLRASASDLIDSEQLKQYLIRICLEYLHIAIPYRFSDEPHKKKFEYSYDAVTIMCISHGGGLGGGLGASSQVTLEPIVSDEHPQVSVRVDAVTEGSIILSVTNAKGFALEMSSSGFFIEDVSWGGSFLNGNERKWKDGLRTSRNPEVGDILSVRIVKETKTIIFGINEHLREFTNHWILSSDTLRVKFKFHGMGNQITLIEYPEYLLSKKANVRE